ncbi:MAG: VOC family protein [Gammaproteobacteria bacterium]|nr:VOC family protein [Gammaproteobacteria bacterium]
MPGIQPYLFFDGRAEEAAEYYALALGAKIEALHRFSEAPPNDAEAGCAGGAPDPDKVMHMQLRIGDATLMASDGQCGNPGFQGFSLSMSVGDADEARRLFTALASDGSVLMPLGPTFFSPAFGMVADKFGVSWMVMVEPSPDADG